MQLDAYYFGVQKLMDLEEIPQRTLTKNIPYSFINEFCADSEGFTIERKYDYGFHRKNNRHG